MFFLAEKHQLWNKTLPRADPQAEVTTMSTLQFRIKGMDCPDEVALLKRQLGPLVGGEERLVFDILNGKMTVQTSDGDAAAEAIRRAVAATGMQVFPGRILPKRGLRPARGFWQQRAPHPVLRWACC
jgi:copper chaperone CopZ